MTAYPSNNMTSSTNSTITTQVSNSNIGVIAGCLLGLLFVAGTLWYACRQRRKLKSGESIVVQRSKSGAPGEVSDILRDQVGRNRNVATTDFDLAVNIICDSGNYSNVAVGDYKNCIRVKKTESGTDRPKSKHLSVASCSAASTATEGRRRSNPGVAPRSVASNVVGVSEEISSSRPASHDHGNLGSILKKTNTRHSAEKSPTKPSRFQFTETGNKKKHIYFELEKIPDVEEQAEDGALEADNSSVVIDNNDVEAYNNNPEANNIHAEADKSKAVTDNNIATADNISMKADNVEMEEDSIVETENDGVEAGNNSVGADDNCIKARNIKMGDDNIVKTESNCVEADNSRVDADNMYVKACNIDVEADNSGVEADNNHVGADNIYVKACNIDVEADNNGVEADINNMAAVNNDHMYYNIGEI